MAVIYTAPNMNIHLDSPMDFDDLPKAQRDTLKLLGNEDLEPFSVEALRARVVELQLEIERCQKALVAKTATKSAADALFGRK